jgi:uncharacterized protein YcbK (DUF882 family)
VQLKKKLSRREILHMGIITAASIIIPEKTFATVETSLSPERRLSLYNIHTEEFLDTVYWKNGHYVPGALTEINQLLRDWRTGKIKPINPELLELLFDLREKLGNTTPFCIVSGYRTPRSNAILKKTQKGVARNSLHMYGKAVDIRLPGYSLRSLRSTAIELKQGGVGYYPYSKFLHLDVGDIRSWTG